MNIFWQEIRLQRKTALIWCLTMIMLAAFFLSIYPAFAQNAQEARKILAAYPAAVLAALGISLETIGLFTGFYSLLFNYVLLCGAIQAMNLGLSLTAREVNDRTAEFLLSKPVSRGQILSAKLLAALTLLLLTNLLFLGAVLLLSWAMVSEPFDMKTFLLISFTLFLVQAIFLSAGTAAAVVLGRVRSIISLSLGTVFALFVINMFSSVIGDRALRFITPFRYFDFTYIMQNRRYEAPFLWTEAAVVAAAAAVSFYMYSRRDVRSD